MNVKVHWIIDGIAEMEADTLEDAEARIDEMLKEVIANNPTIIDELGARAIQGRAYIPGSEDDPERE